MFPNYFKIPTPEAIDENWENGKYDSVKPNLNEQSIVSQNPKKIFLML